MKINGEKIRTQRLALNLKQAEVAQGICQQSTISNIENRNSVSSIDILYAICSRLRLNVLDVLLENDESVLSHYLEHADYLCVHNQHLLAYELLERKVSLDKINEDNLKCKALYLYGITNVLGKKNNDKGLYFFSKVLEINKDVNYVALSKNGLGIIYATKGELEAAQDYFSSSLNDIQSTKQTKNVETLKIYYNVGKFCSSLKDYQRAFDLVEEGLEIAREKMTLYLVDYLSYEKAFNARALKKKEYLDFYRDAQAFASFNLNDIVQEQIKLDLENDQRHFFYDKKMDNELAYQ